MFTRVRYAVLLYLFYLAYKSYYNIVFGIKKIVQVSSFQVCVWFYNAIFSFKVIKNQSGKGTFWTPCIYLLSCCTQDYTPLQLARR